MSRTHHEQNFAQVGQKLEHESASKHVNGSARYIDDHIGYENQCHIAVGGSEISSGRITALDLDLVRRAPGVIDVITAQDIPGQIDIGPVFPGDPLLTSEDIEYWGQPIFAVAATSHRQATRAVKLAKISYQATSPVLDLREAMEKESYVRPPHTMQRGNPRQAIDQANHRVQSEFSVGGQEHFYLEGQVSRAVPEEDGGMTIETSCQNPTETQKLVAEVLALDMNRINVITRRMGGGFGGKETQAAAWSCLAAIVAQRTQTPTSCRLSRRDDMIMTGKRHNFINQYEVGFDDDGRILGIEYLLAGQCGYSPDLSDAIVDRAMFHCDNAYYLPNAQVTGLRCKTNTVSNTAFRGFGGPQGVIAAETVIDEIAYTLGKDALEIRKLNLYGDNDRNITHYHQTISGNTTGQTISQLESSCDYWQRRKSVDEFNAHSPILKKGLALTPVKFGISFTVSHLNQAGALIHIYTDGSIQVNHGGTEMGQGLMTKIAQIVAEVFQVDPERIMVTTTRTDKVPNTSPTAASSGTDLNGMAALNAAKTLKSRIIEFLCESHDVDADTVRFEANQIRVGHETLSFAEAAKSAWLNRVSLSATGFYRTPKIHYDRETASGHPFFYYACGAAASEVIIDTLTGESRVLRADIVHDVGHSINPAIDRGQIEGAYIQGLGWLTCEELKWNDQGRLLTDGPATYKIPAIGDTPDVFNVDLLADSPNQEATIFRSKAVGEPPFMLGISAWCAIRDAISAAEGVKRFPRLDAPATPETILRTISHCRSS